MTAPAATGAALLPDPPADQADLVWQVDAELIAADDPTHPQRWMVGAHRSYIAAVLQMWATVTGHDPATGTLTVEVVRFTQQRTDPTVLFRVTAHAEDAA